MKIWQLPILLLMLSCSNLEDVLDSDIRISAKYIVLDEEFSKSNFNCSDKVLPFSQMDKYSCSFQLAGNEYNIKEKFVLDSLGYLHGYWHYKSEGPIIYSKDELKADANLLNYIKGNNLYVKVLEGGTQVVDSGDTLNIERFFPEEGLIFIERTSELLKSRKRIILKYK
jgi:hypothetical protein